MNVGGERCVILCMIGRVIPNDIDDRRRCATRVVEIGKAVREPGSEVQQRRGRFLRHATVAVGHAGHCALEESEHAPHAVDPVECGDEMHFRCAGIAETNLNARSDKRSQKTFRAVHATCPSCCWPPFAVARTGNPVASRQTKPLS